MKTSTALVSLGLLAALGAAAPARAMTGCDFVDGSHESITFALFALEAHGRGEDRASVLAGAVAEKTDPAWHASMARETVAEVFSGLRPIEPTVYTVYRGMVCYYASEQPGTDLVIDYAAIHPALAACESKPTPRAQGECGSAALDSYLRGAAK